MDPNHIDYECYVRLLDLWSKENPIKTTKLQVLLAVNAALVSLINYTGGFGPRNLPLFLAGALVSLIWTLSIGRTVQFQKIWQVKLDMLAKSHPGDPRFQILETSEAEEALHGWLRVLGSVPSKYYLLVAPVMFSTMWSLGALYVASRSP
jgi:hypothetical protein